MKSLQSLLSNYLRSDTPERFGQWFCNRYIKQPWPELFYEERDVVAIAMVDKWLQDNQYIDDVPQKVGNL